MPGRVGDTQNGHASYSLPSWDAGDHSGGRAMRVLLLRAQDPQISWGKSEMHQLILRALEMPRKCCRLLSVTAG